MPYKDLEKKRAVQRARMKARRVTHRAELNARQRALYAVNIKERRAYCNAWYATHRDEKNARKKIARAQCPEKLKAQKKAHFQANPLRCRQQGIEYQARRRARLRQSKADKIDYAKVIRDANGVCGICKRPFDLFGIHIDHIVPIARGGTHTYDNVQATHARCNQMKWANVG